MVVRYRWIGLSNKLLDFESIASNTTLFRVHNTAHSIFQIAFQRIQNQVHSFNMPKAVRPSSASPPQRASPSDAVPARSLSRTDVLMSIKPEHIGNISSRVKNHEYRKYLLPGTVRYIWFYTVAPVQEIRYVATISPGKRPGEVEEDGGLGNEDFNAGRKVSKFGYRILELRELQQPLSLPMLKSMGHLKGPPQKYCWAPQSLLEENSLTEQKLLFAEAPQVAARSTIPVGPSVHQTRGIRKFFV